jgi:hypothetical protein
VIFFLSLNILDAWLWMGWYIQKGACGLTLHVVAFKSCSGVSIQVFLFIMVFVCAINYKFVPKYTTLEIFGYPFF